MGEHARANCRSRSEYAIASDTAQAPIQFNINGTSYCVASVFASKAR